MKYFRVRNLSLIITILFLYLSIPLKSQVTSEKVTSSLLDFGRMWTFDYPPVDHFTKTYKFTPSKEWLEKARLGALRISGCTASFVSEDGLIMTNHHCARNSIERLDKKYLKEGFYAKSLNEEPKAERMYADQLVLIEDVTKEVQDAFNGGTGDDEKLKNRTKKIQEIEKTYRDKTNLICNVINFFNGGKFSLYGYKRYNDIRIVFAPETELGFFGGDPDNFTYPRYDLDCAFFRAYDESGKPLKPKNFFRWSNGGAKENDVVFVIGNPGRTNRQQTVSQLEYIRDYSYKYTVETYNSSAKIIYEMLNKYPEKKIELENRLFGITNSQKVVDGIVKGLKDQYLMAKKKDFEEKFIATVNSKPELKTKYANIWNEITQIQKEKAKYFYENSAYNFDEIREAFVFSLASDIVDFANQRILDREKPDSSRTKSDPGSILRRTFPTGMELEVTTESLKFKLSHMKSVFAESNEYFNKLLNNLPPEKAAIELLKNTILIDKEKVTELLNKDPDEILNSKDPIIVYVKNTTLKANELQKKLALLQPQEAAKVQILGLALYEVYGTSFPPDGTFTLRISDGVVKSYEYNGTVAPVFTTFYGLYDRYYSFGKRDPWNLPERWLNPPKSFDMSTPLDFISTSDTYGGNSGSPVVNKNLEVVGLNFDRNIDGMPRAFIYTDEKARNVSVHSEGILEALQDIYNADRIVKELKAGKIVE